MPKAYASLHTSKPAHQGDAEVSYEGYARVEMDWTPNLGRVEPVLIQFPPLMQNIGGAACFVAIGIEKENAGGILQLVEMIPNIQLQENIIPKIVFANIPEPLPVSLSRTAKAVWNLVNACEIDAANLHPALFEAVNEELAAAGVPILKVTREGTAKMEIEISKMKSLDLSEMAA
jgi:hypothetical protein